MIFGRHGPAPKSARALDGFGCPTEAPYGCFLPDLTRFTDSYCAGPAACGPTEKQKAADRGKLFLSGGERGIRIGIASKKGLFCIKNDAF